MLVGLAVLSVFSQTSPPSRASPKKDLQIGLSYGSTLAGLTPVTLGNALDDAVDLGVRWIRIDTSWAEIQPDGPNSFQWDATDRVVRAARARRLEVLPVIGFTPAWARPAGCASKFCQPADPAAFGDFVATAALRYASRGVHDWEIWNEPNITTFWQPTPDPAAYTELLRDTRQSLRREGLAPYVLLGGLAAVPTASGNLSQTDFLAAACRLGANQLVDVVSYHPYNFPRLYSARTDFGTAWERIDAYRVNLAAVLRAYGTPDMPVWVTEAGAPTGGIGTAADGTDIPLGTTHVTERWQAQIATDAIQSAVADPHVAALFWYTDRDGGSSANNPEDYFGLRRTDGSPKPAFNALRQAVAALEH
jgi:hypothetical protein